MGKIVTDELEERVGSAGVTVSADVLVSVGVDVPSVASAYY